MSEPHLNDNPVNLPGEVTRRKMLVLEVCALSAFHVVPVVNVLLARAARPYFSEFVKANVATSVSDSVWIGLYLFVIFSSGDRFSDFGLKRISIWRDLAVTAIGAAGSAAIFWRSLLRAPIAIVHLLPTTEALAPIWMLVIHFLISSTFEELAWRGYLITRFEELTGNIWISIMASAVVFASVHLYEGPRGVITSFIFGLWCGVLFSRCRTIWPLVVFHAALDICLSVHHQQLYR